MSKNPGHSINPTIAVSGSNVYVVWLQENAEQTENNVFFRSSSDNGATWGPRVKISSSNSVEKPAVVADPSNNNVYTIWRSNSVGGNNGIYFVRSLDNGATWQDMENLSKFGGSNGAQIAFNGNNLCVFWAESGSDGGTDIWLRTSSDAGANWAPKVMLNIGVEATADFDVAVSGANVRVVWRGGALDGFDEVYYRASTNNGALWGTVKNLSNTPVHSDQAQIAVSGTNVYVTWTESAGPTDDIVLRRSIDGGATWKPIQILRGIFHSSNSQIAASGNNVYAAWSEGRNTGSVEVMIKKSTDGGATWSFAKNLSDTTKLSGRPLLTVLGSNIYVLWDDTSSGNGDVFLRRSADSGLTWKPVKNLNPTTTDSGGYQMGL